MVKLLIVDDHVILREGLKQILAGQGDIEVTGEASNAEELMELARTKAWDLILLDIGLPDRNGLDVLERLRSAYPGKHVVILSMYADEQYAIRALKYGASGYLTKETASKDLLVAIRKVAQGGRYISPQVGERLAFHVAAETHAKPHETLSVREMQIMLLISKGRTLTEIAEDLAVSIKTVSTHRSRILRKMGLRNNAEIVRYAVQNQL